ncbi:unnamed protein product [Mytilus coruscus]|uniref:EGF-like domain-containing protein n=1 Tax=Mytilus coruscus TaxID=42192 RepID=A0A6J8ADR0_MYTCO|nr:unnamed protein product [Mytilus coruscus]
MVQNDRLISLLRRLIIIFLTTITVNGWRVVFKVSMGRLSSGNSMYQLWNSSDVVNDNPSGFHTANHTYMAPYQPTYKSSIVNQWTSYGIEYVKLGLYSSGKEAVVVVFNGTETNKTAWFNSGLILQSTYPDLTSSNNYHFSLEGTYGTGRFQAFKAESTDCDNANGWFTTIDKDIISHCGNKTINTPYFLYSPNPNSMILKDFAVADAFAVFVDDCVVNSCQFGGTCTAHMNGYNCQCVDQIHGQSCQYQCPCLHQGKCLEINSSHISSDGRVFIDGQFINDEAIHLDSETMVACKCPQNYIGVDCKTTTLQCASSPCLNYGVCIEGQMSYTCQCTEDYTGQRCQVTRPLPPEKGLNIGAKVAIGLCIPLVVIIGLVIAYIVYLFKNPGAYGHEATVKQYTIAREFVRRSIRRMSGRRGKNSDETKDTVAFSPKDTDASVGQVNLAFDDAGKTGFDRQNSEYYNLSAGDNAVVSGQTTKYSVNTSQYAHPDQRKTNYSPDKSSPSGNKSDAFYKEYRPAHLHGGDDDRYTHPGHRYDEYNSNSNPVPQPRKQRQTGRRGRTNNDQTDDQQSPLPSSNYEPDINKTQNVLRTHQPTDRCGYDGQSMSITPRHDNLTNNTGKLQSPRFEPSRPNDKYNSQTPKRQQQYSENEVPLSPRYLPAARDRSTNDSMSYARNNQPHNTRKVIDDTRLSPGYRLDQNIPERSFNDATHSPSYQHPSYNDQRRSPNYRHGERPSVEPSQPPAYRQTYDRPTDDPRISPGYGKPESRHNQGYNNQISQRNNYDSNDSYNQRREQAGFRPIQSHEGIVFTSSEPMDDVTV